MLVAMMLATVSGVWADELEFRLNELYQDGNKVTAKTVIATSGTLTFTDENENFSILLTRNSGNQPGFYTSSGYFRFYNSDVVTLSAAEGITITKIVVTANGSSFSVESMGGLDEKTWTGSASEVTFTGSGTNKWDKLTITYTTDGGGDTELEDNDLALTDAPIALTFDLYNNSTAQTIHYTTSSTGEVSVEAGQYDVSCYVDNENKTITVTPFAVTNGPQTVTVNQAANGTYKAGSVTFTVTVTDSTPIETHNATFSVNGVTSTQEFEKGADIEFPDDPDDVSGKTFVGWVAEAIDGTTNEAPEFVTFANMGESDITYYAVFALS